MSLAYRWCVYVCVCVCMCVCVCVSIQLITPAQEKGSTLIFVIENILICKSDHKLHYDQVG